MGSNGVFSRLATGIGWLTEEILEKQIFENVLKRFLKNSDSKNVPGTKIWNMFAPETNSDFFRNSEALLQGLELSEKPWHIQHISELSSDFSEF